MTEKELKEKCTDLFERNITLESFIKKVDKVIRSGAIDLSEYDNNYVLPKLLLTLVNVYPCAASEIRCLLYICWEKNNFWR